MMTQTTRSVGLICMLGAASAAISSCTRRLIMVVLRYTKYLQAFYVWMSYFLPPMTMSSKLLPAVFLLTAGSPGIFHPNTTGVIHNLL
jgi:hypothetical protein